MKTKDHFFKAVCTLAIPVALQSMLQSSFSMVDQIMIGQLGEINVAGVGLAGKFASIYSVVISAIGAVAGIMIAQYLGQKNRSEVRRSFFTNLLLGAGIAGMFMVICTLFPNQIMGAYTRDVQTRQAAAEYLMLISGTFVPMAGATLLSTLFRCLEKPRLPLYASILSALLNTSLNYIMIFGKRQAGDLTHGCAWCGICYSNFPMCQFSADAPNAFQKRFPFEIQRRRTHCNTPNELGAVLVYAAAFAGMRGGVESGGKCLCHHLRAHEYRCQCCYELSQAASVIIGKHLGSGENEEAYWSAKKLMLYGAIGSALLSVIVMIASKAYVGIYQVDNAVKTMTMQILFAYAIVVPFKVLNMILGGGIIRSGGRTKYVMFIDMVGTWCFGVPLGLLSAFVWKLSIPYVYFLLSLEECIRFGISLIVFRRRKWMNQLEAS